MQYLFQLFGSNNFAELFQNTSTGLTVARLRANLLKQMVKSSQETKRQYDF